MHKLCIDEAVTTDIIVKVCKCLNYTVDEMIDIYQKRKIDYRNSLEIYYD